MKHMPGCNELFLRVDLCRFDENNHFLTEIEAGSTEKFLVIRFLFMKMMPPDVISHENQLQHTSEPSIFVLNVFRTADHAAQIFIPHRQSYQGHILLIKVPRVVNSGSARCRYCSGATFTLPAVAHK